MSNLVTIPIEDDFETTLSSVWSGWTGVMNVNSTPDGTMPASQFSYIVVDPWKINMQVAKIDSWVTNTSFNVSSISVAKGSGVNYSQQTHAAGAIVRFSNNYQFWKDILDAVNSKADLDSAEFQTILRAPVYADATARDAAIPSPANWMLVYNTALWVFQQYVSWAWTDIAAGSTPNASTTVAGKVEIATSAESIAGTDTGGTGALLSVLPSDIAKNTQSSTFIYGADVWGDDTYVVALTPTLAAYTTGQILTFKATTANTGACSVDFWPWPKSIKTLHWNDPADGVIDGMCMVQYDGTNFVLYNNNDDVLATAIEDVWNYFGDGSDGDVTISSNTTLVSDRYYNNLTVNNGVTLNTWWFRIYVKETLTNDWTISRSGWNGGNGWSWTWTGWSLGAAGWGWAGWAWGQWGNNGAGATGSAWGWSTNDISWVNGWIGWAGWAWGWGWAAWGAGAAGVPASTTTAIFWIYNYSWFSSTVTTNLNDTKKIMEVFNILLTSWSSTLQVGSWWGGWGWWGSPSGGSNGWSWWGWWGSWWVVFICAKTIVNAWAIAAHWWNGGNWWTATGNGWGWGSGWGGSGGLYILLYKTLSWAWTTTATAGIAWVRSIWAGTWANGNNGASGVAGKFIKIAITGNIT